MSLLKYISKVDILHFIDNLGLSQEVSKVLHLIVTNEREMSSQNCRVPHMFACVSMNSGVLQWWECTSADQRPKSSIFLFHTPPYFLKHTLSLNVELTESARVADQKVPQRAIYLASTKISGLVLRKIKLKSHNYGNKCITKASPQPCIESFEIESPSL